MIQKQILILSLVVIASAKSPKSLAETLKPITLRCDDLRESSGLAWSNRQANRIWTHNDSGDSPRLFCFDATTGKQTGQAKLTACKAIDWESMAVFTDGDGTSKLIIADCGDNQAKRKHILLHVFDEPDPDKSSTVKPDQRATVKLQHAGGPMDCEAITVDVSGDNLILISKRFLPAAIVETVPVAQLIDGESVTAHRLVSIAVPMVTGVDVDTKTGDFWISSYFNLFRYRSRAGDSLLQQFSREADVLPVPKLKQIEAIAVDANGTAWVTTEGVRATLAPAARRARGK